MHSHIGAMLEQSTPFTRPISSSSGSNPELNIYDEDWPIWTYQAQTPPAKFVLDEDGRRGVAINSLVSGGAIISGATVRESLLFSGVRVEERSVVERSVILPDVRIGSELPDPQRHHR